MSLGPRLLCVLALLALAGCGGRGLEQAPALPGSGLPPLSQLDALARKISATQSTSINGADALLTSGAPSATVSNTFMVLDGDQAAAGQVAWGIWSVTLGSGKTVADALVTLPQNGIKKRHWLAYADWSAGRWVYLDTAGEPLGRVGSQDSVTPADPGVLLSPAGNVYIAVVVLGGQSPDSKINVGQVSVDWDPIAGPDPIADAYEDNDTLDTCYALDAGTYHASIHETFRNDMSDPAEYRDKLDFYCIDIPPGKQLTATLRHEMNDHFGVEQGAYNDLDILFYDNTATSWANDFIEADSSTQVPYGFEQIHLTGLSGMYKLGIVPDISDGWDENAGYDLSIFYSDSTHSVSGKVKQNSQNVTVRFAVFLEPGNFNVATDFDTGHEGEFTISGVPDGTYTLKVQGSNDFGQGGYEYATTLPNIVVNGSDVTGANIDIEPYPGP